MNNVHLRAALILALASTALALPACAGSVDPEPGPESTSSTAQSISITPNLTEQSVSCSSIGATCRNGSTPQNCQYVVQYSASGQPSPAYTWTCSTSPTTS